MLLLLKILGIILAVILLAVLVIIFTPLKMQVVYPSLKIFVKWNGIKYRLYPLKEKKTQSKEKKEEPPSHEPPKKAETVKPEEHREEDPDKKPKKKTKSKKSGVLKDISRADLEKKLRYAGIALEAIGKIVKGTVFEKLFLSIKTGGADKAKTALDYGRLCVFFTCLQPFLDEHVTIKKQRIDIGADMDAESWRFGCDIIVYIRPITVLTAAAAAYLKLRKEGKNE